MSTISSSSLPLKFAFIFSLSLAGTASIATTATKKPTAIRFHLESAQPPLSRPKATASDLLSVLGTPQQARNVDPIVAQELFSCFKFLVPFPRTLGSPRRSLGVGLDTGNAIDERILSPPASVLEIARLAVDSGGAPAAIHRTLDPAVIMVPDVEGCNEDQCELTRTPYGRHFVNEELNSYMEFLFDTIVKRGPSVGLNVTLSRYDFFHGHVFIAPDSGRLGILFHAKEYPAYDKEVFPYNMGYCQVGSNVAYDDLMNLRNILWLAPFPSNSTDAWSPGVLVVLDANPKGIIYQDLIPEYVQVARTLYEDDFGDVVFDVNYLNVGAEVPKFQLFIC